MDACGISCTVNIEELSPTGIVQKKTQHRNILLLLGRDEFREIVLKLQLSKKEIKYSIKEVVIHKKFIKDGKATIKLPETRVQFLISNCPPDKLVMFIKTLQTKLECLKQKGFISLRKKLLSDERKAFSEISPLTIKDLQEAQKIKKKQEEVIKPQELNSKKRKRPDDDIQGKENAQVAKKALTCPPSLTVAAPVVLSKEQNMVLDIVLRGRNIFFTGSAGTGKSFLLKRIIGALPPHHTFATASTGVAACHIGGTTLHAFAGIGSGKAPLEQCIELASRKLITQQWRKCRHLIIDEISMVDGDYLIN
ncbi:ATP-dependent DNA helicase PIF1-like [Patella vulgata]|uniref:ATP-dependent DNA helicase PIF1-like n=1 Tax=Patella vulgata TaxID=6465 RepID=UPI0024A85F13|nr:ATP-dependent DNA helicase PIF1-like [Patella vulgata]